MKNSKVYYPKHCIQFKPIRTSIPPKAPLQNISKKAKNHRKLIIEKQAAKIGDQL
jgi:hypothetical protein